MKKYLSIILTLCASFCMAADSTAPAVPIADVGALVANPLDDSMYAENSYMNNAYPKLLNHTNPWGSTPTETSGTTVSSAGILTTKTGDVNWYKMSDGNTLMTQKGPGSEFGGFTWIVNSNNKLVSASTLINGDFTSYGTNGTLISTQKISNLPKISGDLSPASAPLPSKKSGVNAFKAN